MPKHRVQKLSGRQCRQMFNGGHIKTAVFSAQMDRFGALEARANERSLCVYPLDTGGFGWIVWRPSRPDQMLDRMMCGGRSPTISDKEAIDAAVSLLLANRAKRKQRSKRG